MIKKRTMLLILIMAALCLGADSYGAQSDRTRAAISTVYFQNGSIEIAAEFENDLKKVQVALEADSASGLQIEGYGHSQGPPGKNREISKKRAEAVRRWFVKHGVDASRLAIKSFGGLEPTTQKNGPDDPALTERVEIFQVSLKQPSADLPVTRYAFTPVMEGQEVIHDFIVQNKGSALLEIQRVKTD